MPRRCFAIIVVLLAPIVASAQDGWLVFRGNPARTGAASGLPAWKERVSWKRTLLMDKTEGYPNIDADERAKELIEKLRKDAETTILPGSFPIIVNGLCVYASHRDVRCVTLQDFVFRVDQNQLETLNPGKINWKTLDLDCSLSVVVQDPKLRDPFTKILASLQREKREHLLWANPLIGSSSCDGKVVYIIKDIAHPIPEILKMLPRYSWPFWRGNELHAYDASSGKRLWDTGSSDPRRPLGASFILGAPLWHDTMLFLPNEKDGELRLLQMNAFGAKLGVNGDSPIEKLLPLLKIPEREQILHSPLRRTQPLHIAHDANLLVCPTNAGFVVGVDRVGMAIRWTYRYRDEKTAAPAHPHWQAACPVLLKDRIVFTAADAPDVHCIGLDGKKKWTAAADNDLYLAVATGDTVMLVGKPRRRGLSLADGSVKWTLATGLPAGVGVLDDTTYYLPLKRDGGVIWAIDLAKGSHASTIKVAHPDALGNLILHRGMFVSQSVTHIAAFPLPKK